MVNQIKIKVHDGNGMEIGPFIYREKQWYLGDQVIRALFAGRGCCQRIVCGEVVAQTSAKDPGDRKTFQESFDIRLGCCEAFCSGPNALSIRDLESQIKQAASKVFRAATPRQSRIDRQDNRPSRTSIGTPQYGTFSVDTCLIGDPPDPCSIKKSLKEEVPSEPSSGFDAEDIERISVESSPVFEERRSRHNSFGSSEPQTRTLGSTGSGHDL